MPAVYLVDHSRLSARPNRKTLPRPFLKWVGGKRQLIPPIVRRLPRRLDVYHEPFIGGGALFFHLRPTTAVLADANLRLVRTYRAVRDEVDDLIDLLQTYPYEKNFFLEMRARDIDVASDVEVAAWFIYLNRAGFNGLYRVNRRNKFNVPFGRYKRPLICDEQNLRACSDALRGCAIVHQDFSCVVDQARTGDFVYFDPPYVPLSATSSFTSYNHKGFDIDDQVRVRDVALGLKSRGVSVLLSNSSAPAVYNLYADGFDLEEVLASRAINRDAQKRGKIPELLIR